MKALVFHAPRDVRCETVPDPAPLEAGDVVCEIECTAICGSDLHVWRGNETGLDPGTVLGHEFVGRVVAVGAGVERFAPGDRVVAPFTTSCGVCAPCREGLSSRCERGCLFGWVEGGEGLEGVQAEFARVPLADTTLVAVPDGLSPEEALLAGDVLSTGYFCARSARIEEGAKVCVLGCGPVGLMAIASARELGAEEVLAVDSVPERLELARRFGGRPIPLDRGTGEAVRSHTEGRGANAVLEVVGSPSASRLALEVVRAGGTISAVGVHTEEHFAFSPGDAYDRNLTYVAGRSPARALAPRMLEWLVERRYPFGAVFSHRMDLEDGALAYELFDAKRDGCTKVLFTPSTPPRSPSHRVP